MTGSTVLALSQSGRTPDVVEYVTARAAPRRVHDRVTNDPDSELARAADACCRSPPGQSTRSPRRRRTRTSSPRSRCSPRRAAGRGAEIADGLRATRRPARSRAARARGASARAIALPFASVGRMFVIGRGPEFATAREIALKLLETCRVAAEPFTATDLAHGPVAALDPLFPVWAIASRRRDAARGLEAAARIRAAGATLVASGDAAEALAGAAYVLPVPKPPPPLLSPLLSVVPGQLFARALARAKGLDPDRPAGLSKVTLAHVSSSR